MTAILLDVLLAIDSLQNNNVYRYYTKAQHHLHLLVAIIVATSTRTCGGTPLAGPTVAGGSA